MSNTDDALYCDFNPHSREGSDKSMHYWGDELHISIHTPAKGVTDEGKKFSQLAKISIHTPAKGVTGGLLEKMGSRYISIHTPAKGVTRCLDVEFLLRQFQSTLPRRE